MKNPKLARAVRLAVLTAGAATIAVPAIAQEVIEEIVVTGSRIQRSDLEAVSPMTIIDNAEFVISGNINVEQKLAELSLTLPSFGASSNNPGDGTARVNLRGLGTSRTLVLVNGRRWMPSTQSGVVDLNTIPGTLLERVDILTGGASAVYGSDAIAGVVNFDMIDDFEGVEVTALYDVTSESDAYKLNLDITIGGNFADGRGNAVLYAGYVKRDPLFQGERDFSRFALGDAAPAGTPGQDGSTGVGGPLAASGSSGVPGTRVFGGPTVTPPGGGADFTLGTFDSSGSALPWVEPDSRFNYAPDNFLQLPQERYTISTFAHYDIAPEVRAYTELAFFSNNVPQELAPTPAFLGGLEVNPNSPYFAPEVQAALPSLGVNADGNVSLPFIGRRMVENGSRQSLDNRDAFRVLAGLKGDINDNWSYDGYYSHSNLNYSQLLNNDVSDTRFRQAVLVTDDGLACQDPSGGCAPMNIFGPGNINQAAIDFVNVGAANVTNIQQNILNISFSGRLGSIGNADPIGVAFGYEYRRDESSFRPDEFLSAGDVLGFNAGESTAGSFSVDEFFAEIDIPLLTDVPFAKHLSVWGAVRSSDYSTVGKVSTYAGALNWAPVDMVTIRAGLQTAVRAPNVSELFLGNANGFPGATDPCSVGGTAGDNIADNGAVGATLRALCEAQGVAAANVGIFTQANTQIEGRFGGNPNLTEETSDTFTFGIVIRPLDGLDITIDYFDIQVEDSISVLGGGVNNVLDICYNQVQDLNSAFCQAITRRADGNVDLVNVLNENIGKLETSGFDVNINYVTDLSFGLFNQDSTLAITFRSTFLDEFNVTPVVGLPDVNKCAGNFGDICGTPRNEDQFNTRFTWNTGPLGVSLLWRYLGSAADDTIENDGVDASTLSVPKIDSISYFDLSGSYDVTDNFRVNVGIKNLFEEQTTFVGDVQQQANTFPELYDVLGRRYFISGSYRFE